MGRWPACRPLRRGHRSSSENRVFARIQADADQGRPSKNGFAVVLLVVCLDDPQRLLARVRQRVQEGGHDVPRRTYPSPATRAQSENLTLPFGVLIW